MEQDVVTHQGLTKNSEIKRVELQAHIKQTTIQIVEDAQKNKQF